MGSPNPGLFSSTTDEWPTPRELFATLDREFGFTLDPCATPNNATCPAFFTPADDGLSRPWPGRVYMNPPYGRQIGAWVRKAYEESRGRAEVVVCLIPARTDTAYWHDYVMRAAELRLIAGRLHFSCARQDERRESGDSKAHNAPFPSALVVFRPGVEGPPFVRSCDRSGAVVGDRPGANLRRAGLP